MGDLSMPPLAKEFLTQYIGRLRVPQVRVLLALAGENEIEVPWAPSRAKIHERCGFTPKSGTVVRVMHGLTGITKSGSKSKSGTAHSGLLEMGLVEVIYLDVDGVVEEQFYRITLLGRRVLESVLEGYSSRLSRMRSVSASTNDRYKKVSTSLDSDQSEIYGQERKEVYAI